MSLTEQELGEIVARVLAQLEPPPQVEPLAIDNTHFQVVTGEVIQADHVNSLANQSVPKYPNQAALTSDWPAPAVGALAYLQDINAMVVYDSPILGGANAWHVLGGLRMGYGLMGANAAGTAQVVPNNVDTLLTMRAVSGAANKAGRGTWNADGSVTLPLTGTYLVAGTIVWPSNPTGDRAFYVKRYQADASAWTQNGVAGGSTETNTPGGSFLRMSVTAMVAAVAGEKIGLYARQGSGASLTLPQSSDSAKLAVHLLGAE